jgi:hypothetical protein
MCHRGQNELQVVMWLTLTPSDSCKADVVERDWLVMAISGVTASVLVAL